MADRIVAPGTPEHREWLAEYQRDTFKLATLSPGVWVEKAEQHKRAANVLYEIVRKAMDRDTERQEREWATARATPGDATSECRRVERDELEDFYDRQMLSEYLLLSGYALECLLKGYLLAILPELLQDGERLDRVMATHDLQRLFHDCGLKTSDEENGVLDTISRQVVWGKYPAPLHLKDWPTLVSGKVTAIPSSVERWLRSSIDQLYDRAAELHKRR